MINVVSGLIVEGDEILMALRHPEQIPGNVWEIPGGKVEKGETERDALVREMKEELGIDVSVGPLLSVASFNWECRINMLLFACEPLSLKDWIMQPLESQKLSWYTPLYARQRLPCLPSLFTWFPDIVSYMKDKKASRPTPGWRRNARRCKKCSGPIEDTRPNCHSCRSCDQ